MIRSYDFISFDGVTLKVHEMGEGKPLLLLHGLFSNAHMNWIKYGHAVSLVKAGFRLIMPDLRAHGDSEAPHEASYYPEDIIIKDIETLIKHYSWNAFDVTGFSLGARSIAKLLINGMKPDRAILAGMGWEGINGWGERQQFFLDVIENYHSVKRGDPHFMPVQFMKTTGIDPIAAGHLLKSFGTLDTDILCGLNVQMMVVCGKDDRDNGSGQLLADHLKNACFEEIPGNHMSSVIESALSEKMVSFLEG